MMMTMMPDMTQSLVAAAMFAWALFLQKYVHKIAGYFWPYVKITFYEYQADCNWCERSKSYASIERYLNANSSGKARRLKVTDEFHGVKIRWTSSKKIPAQRALFSYSDEEKRYYKFTCRREHRDIVTNVYLKHVLEEGEAIAVKTRKRKLYSNNKSKNWGDNKRSMWSHIIFEHPSSTFDTLAMDPKKKKEVLKDLKMFSKSKEYYKKVDKSWNRRYLLYGPPGTGKSSMVAAMANLLEYDIYDLELNSVKDNTDLRKLLIETSSKSIIVIEDIDCSLDLTGQRKKKKEESKEGDEKDPIKKKAEEEEDDDKKKKGSEVTLSGLLNFIDGLWSSCGSERLIVFTTNYVEKLDPALIKSGRMDKHIEMSYCCYETFKVLAKNYLDLESHELFETICQMLGETKMTSADVAENLMPKSNVESSEICLKNLIKSLEEAKEEARLKALEDANQMKTEDEAAAKKKKEENSENLQGIDAKLGAGEEEKKAGKEVDKVQVM